MRRPLRGLRTRLQKIPPRIRWALVLGLLAVAALTWQHYSTNQDSSTPTTATQSGSEHDEQDGHAHGEYQPDPSDLPPPPDFSTEAARTIVERFAANFASPNGNHADWLARIAPDVAPELADQYRLTDIRNVPQATVTSVTGPLNGDTLAPTFLAAYNDGAQIEITVGMDIEGWTVSSVVPAANPAVQPPPAAPNGP